MSRPTKICPTHTKRLAIIYIRQSSVRQVEENKESQLRQYQLAERAEALGWPSQRQLVIDDDLGLSGAHAYNRPGYQRLTSMLAVREVGVVFGLEVSRLARNCLDWYQLLELAAAFDVLIADEQNLYDPSDFNDRLVLGLHGTFSEIERYQIRARLVQNRLNKAERGELKVPLPVGFEHDPLTKEVEKSPDQSVRHAIEDVFELFAQLGSVRGVLLHLRLQGAELPHRLIQRGLGTRVEWRQPSYDAIYRIITNPVYSGVYCYGRRQVREDPLHQARHVHRVPQEEWQAFLPDHHEGYISYAQYEENMASLRNNRLASMVNGSSQGPPREGATLLQGLVYCERCGQRMRVVYHQKDRAYYCCDYDHRRYGASICGWASAKRVDALMEDLVLGVLGAGTLELSLESERRWQEETSRVERQWQEKLQRLEYESQLSQQRYEMVDPANRLVAGTLETQWNEKLLALEEARQEHQRRQQPHEMKSTLAEIRVMLANLPEYWHSGTITAQEKKELLRCVVEWVSLECQGKVIEATVHWYGGASSELEVPKYLATAGSTYYRVLELARTHTDAEVAADLNAAGTLTARGKSWTSRRIMDFRLSNGIPSGTTVRSSLRLPDSGYLTTAEVAELLGVNVSVVQRWFHCGIFEGKQDHRRGQLWIAWDEETAWRLAGSAAPDPRMVTVRRLCAEQSKSPQEVLNWARDQGHTIFRLRRGKKFRFYVLPGDAQRRSS